MRLFSNRSQRTSKCGKNISDTLGYASCATFLFLPHFDVICDLLLNRRTATWNLFVKYISRHDKAAAYLHWNICQDHDIEVIDKWYEHKPESVTHNKDSKITIMWDMPVNTDRTITANRPDIIIKDSVNSTCKLIDMSVPSDRNIALKEIEKKGKYKDLELEIQRMWQMKTEVIPVVVGALGTIKKGMVENIKRVSERANVTETQKISMLGSARILRKVLNV